VAASGRSRVKSTLQRRQGGAESGEAGGVASRNPGPSKLASQAAHHQQQQNACQSASAHWPDQRCRRRRPSTVPLTRLASGGISGRDSSRHPKPCQPPAGSSPRARPWSHGAVEVIGLVPGRQPLIELGSQSLVRPGLPSTQIVARASHHRRMWASIGRSGHPTRSVAASLNLPWHAKGPFRGVLSILPRQAGPL